MSNEKIPGRFEILLVEDNPDDIALARQAFEEGKGLTNLNVVNDGLDALAFLYRQGAYLQAPVPDLILLDLNLPRKNGQEVLAEIKQDPNLRRIPVIVLTTSTAEEDVLTSYSLRANAYVTKPLNRNEFIALVASIEEFWLSTVRLPTRQWQ